MEEKYIGYLKYQGKLVENGALDARKAAQALLGFDEAIRFFLGQQSSVLKECDFEIPVKIKQGSWEAYLPQSILGWIFAALGTGLTAGVTAYCATAGKKMAENDFSEKGLKDIFIRAFEALQWVVRIGKHVGDVTLKKFEKLKFENDNEDIGIPNDAGVYLFVPRIYYLLFISTSPKLLRKIANLIEKGRELEIGVDKEGQVQKENITYEQKSIFTNVGADENVLFPEFKHGQFVELEGHITRGNENTNSLGLLYNGHVLNCQPEAGSIVRFKDSLFLFSRIRGQISREDRFGEITETKPKIIFSTIESRESESNPSLF